MCGVSSESVPHMFLHWSMVGSLWNMLLDIFGECWVCLRTFDLFLLTSFIGFGKNKEAKSSWSEQSMPLFDVFGWSIILVFLLTECWTRRSYGIRLDVWPLFDMKHLIFLK